MKEHGKRLTGSSKRYNKQRKEAQREPIYKCMREVRSAGKKRLTIIILTLINLNNNHGIK